MLYSNKVSMRVALYQSYSIKKRNSKMIFNILIFLRKRDCDLKIVFRLRTGLQLLESEFRVEPSKTDQAELGSIERSVEEKID